MFVLAILIGIYSYLIFILGFLNLLYKSNIVMVTLACFAFGLVYYFKYFRKIHFRFLRFDLIPVFLIALISIQLLVNLIGVLSPELAFDALWYHLTLPKIYLSNNSIFHIPGGLFYYSDMPKLTEMLYISALSFQGETLAKLIHLLFGFLTLLAIYKISRKFFSRNISLLAVVVFYSNLVVAWESTTAYIDLGRTFFEIMALWSFLNFSEKKEKKWLIISSIMLGLAITTKVLALGSLPIFTGLLFYLSKNLKKTISEIILFCFFSLLVPLPYFIFSFINTGNPVYPFFTSVYKVGADSSLFSFSEIIKHFWSLFVFSSDPISPIYLISLPLVFLVFRKFNNALKIITFYSLFSLIIWYFTPMTGGGRFILPYLPAFSIIVIACFEFFKDKKIKYILLSAIVFVSLTSIFYRSMAEKKYLPVLIGRQLKGSFLTKNLNFSFGDFYDVNLDIKKIVGNRRVLIYGGHNLYYADFSFIHVSYVKKGDTFNYILTQDFTLPERFRLWKLVYQNGLTRVKLYSAGGQEWVY